MNFEQFYKTVEKIGVLLEKEDVQKVFKHYDENGNGVLDYKEFAYMFTNGTSPPEK